MTSVYLLFFYLSIIFGVGYVATKYIWTRYQKNYQMKKALEAVAETTPDREATSEEASHDVAPITRQASRNITEKKEAITLYKKGEMHHARNLPEEAKSSLLKALSYDPDHLDSLVLLGDIYLKEGSHSKAVQLLSDAHQRRSQDPEIATSLATAIFQERRENYQSETIIMLEKAQQSDPSNPERMIHLAEIHLYFGDLSSALQHYREALHKRPRDTELMVQVIDLLREAGEQSTAREMVERLLTLSPQHERGIKIRSELEYQQ